MTEHVPDPTAMSGTLETTNTGGGAHERLSGVTRVFHHAEAVARNLVQEILHHGGHAEAVTQPVSQIAEDAAEAPEDGLLGTVPVTEPEEAPEAPQEGAEDPETAAEDPAAAENPAEDAPAAPKTARKRAAAKPAPDAPAEAAQ